MKLTTLLHRHSGLLDHKREQAEELEETNKLIKIAERQIMDAMIEEGVPSMAVTIDGQAVSYMPTPYVYARYADGQSPEALIQALKMTDGADLVKESLRIDSVSAWLREELADGRAVPDALAGVIEMASTTKLSRTTKAANKSQSARAARAMES